ncbi:MAG: serine hydrolase [Anaerolineae bacterium]|jgi:CubicO group peptidase (beta-lactamase class C family)|nr:serine hydrolase [Anaerolineae bacterium]
MNLKNLQETITSHNDPEPFSGVVHISKGDEVLFAEGFGYAQRAEEILNRPDTRFQMASGCKIFTAVAALKLIEQGKLSLATKLFDHLEPDVLPGFSRDVTVEHLLTHSSGITSYFEEDVNPDYEDLWQDTPVYKVRRPADFLQKFTNPTQKFTPGEKFEYNDGGFILLGLLCEIASGKVFPDLVQELVFDPAGMIDSGYFATDQLPKGSAYAYIHNEDGSWRTNFFAVPIIGAPDGGAYTTGPDMARFWKALFSHQLLSPALTAEMLKPKITTGWDAPYTHYGYGVWLYNDNGKPLMTYIEGEDPGVALRSAYLHEKDITLTLLGNTMDSLWGMIAKVEGEL